MIPKNGTVYFIGAGPGAPDLITVRGQEIIAQADLILYADSLVEQSVADLSRKDSAVRRGSSDLHLEQMLELMVNTAQQGGIVARIHSGDPGLYGAIHEQMAHLDDYNIPYEIVPGVTVAFAAAAQLKIGLTVPDVVQTIILTRTAGRTTMPVGEELRKLAAPGASLAIYLSITRIRRVVDDLLTSGGYKPNTPVAVFHKITWPDESMVTGTLVDIADKVRQAGYTKHALILVSPAIDESLKTETRRTSSHLYDKSYTHRFRRAVDDERGKEKQEVEELVNEVVIGDKHLARQTKRTGTFIVSLTKNGTHLALKLRRQLAAFASIPEKFELANDDQSEQVVTHYSAIAAIQQNWADYAQLILVMPTGVAVRAVAPLLGNKSIDPAVVCLDEAGQSVVSLLGGHRAGANALAQSVATLTGGRAAITTASDVQGKPALDLPPEDWKIARYSALTHASACLVNDEPLGIYLEPELASLRPQIETWLKDLTSLNWVTQIDELDSDAYSAIFIVSHKELNDHHVHFLNRGILYHPPVLVVGMGCKRGESLNDLSHALDTTLSEAYLSPLSVGYLTTLDIKSTEIGLHELATQHHHQLTVFKADTIREAFPPNENGEWPDFSPSAAQQKFNVPGVAEASARYLANGPIVVPKRVFTACTVAVALKT